MKETSNEQGTRNTEGSSFDGLSLLFLNLSRYALSSGLGVPQ
jgi:hypothetical protein